MFTYSFRIDTSRILEMCGRYNSCKCEYYDAKKEHDKTGTYEDYKYMQKCYGYMVDEWKHICEIGKIFGIDPTIFTDFSRICWHRYKTDSINRIKRMETRRKRDIVLQKLLATK